MQLEKHVSALIVIGVWITCTTWWIIVALEVCKSCGGNWSLMWEKDATLDHFNQIDSCIRKSQK